MWAEAISAGGLVGAFQGLLFSIWLPIVIAMKEPQSEDTVLLVLFFLSVGTIAGALLGAALGAIGRAIRAIGDGWLQAQDAPIEEGRSHV
jgi:hypothetical protein